MNSVLKNSRTFRNLVPARSPFGIVDYVCTWGTQAVVCGGGKTVRDVLTDEALFGKNGWAYHFDEEIRKDLIFLLDDGWDLPLSKNGQDDRDHYGSFILDPMKFPGYGRTYVDRLKTLSDKIKAAGWYGLGVWVCCQEDAAHKTADGGWDENYWIDKILWSKASGICYWKNDWGDYAYTHPWRQFISDMANRYYPELIIEHITGDYGTNDPLGSGTCETRIENMLRCASYSDVFRSYDVTEQLCVATTMDRVTRILKDIRILPGDHMGLLNCEDSAYLAAALGLSAGIMRSKLNGKGDLDEISRMVAWHRIAPPFDMSAYPNHVSDLNLTDAWHFTDDTWDTTIQHKTVKQHSAAAVSRGIDLPTAQGDEIPFLAASRNPVTGAVSIVTLRRTSEESANHPVYADISLNAGALTGPIGIFGVYSTLTLTFDRDITGLTVLAQDLKGDTAFDITDLVTVEGNTLTVCGELLKAVGTEAASADDPSEPGLMLRIGEKADWAKPAPTLPRA